eukprot:m.86730 g.86730  ORF g.86730 m.86730 type:complete len:330 (+) comp15106_c0_seq1:2340-3329(+)
MAARTPGLSVFLKYTRSKRHVNGKPSEWNLFLRESHVKAAVGGLPACSKQSSRPSCSSVLSSSLRMLKSPQMSSGAGVSDLMCSSSAIIWRSRPCAFSLKGRLCTLATCTVSPCTVVAETSATPESSGSGCCTTLAKTLRRSMQMARPQCERAGCETWKSLPNSRSQVAASGHSCRQTTSAPRSGCTTFCTVCATVHVPGATADRCSSATFHVTATSLTGSIRAPTALLPENPAAAAAAPVAAAWPSLVSMSLLVARGRAFAFAPLLLLTAWLLRQPSVSESSSSRIRHRLASWSSLNSEAPRPAILLVVLCCDVCVLDGWVDGNLQQS